MSQYTTGELAKMCNISVRSIQFYDAKDLLKPTALTEGGRRLYSDDDLRKLRFICLLKSLGMSLDAIKTILESESPEEILLLLLNEQQKVIDFEIKDKQRQLQVIRVVKESILDTKSIPIQAISDIEHMINNKRKLRRTNITMLALCIAAALLFWLLTKGHSLLFEMGFPILTLWGIRLMWIQRKSITYFCVHCNAVIQPSIRETLFSKHSLKTIRLKCSNCKKASYTVCTYFID